jgi:hypothetical protein
MSFFDADLKLMKLDSEGWQLYSSMTGAGLAAHNLTEATRKALGTMKDSIADGDGVLTAAKKAYAHVYEVMKKYADFGACDTEPRGVLIQVIEEYARRRFEADLDLYWEV